MKKSWIMIMLILVLLTLASSTYAWFTYVQRKSLVSFISNDILYQFHINDEPVIENMLIDDLVYVDYEDDILNNQSLELETVSSFRTFEIILSASAPYVQVELDIQGLNQIGLIAILVESSDLASFDLHAYLLTIIDPLESKEVQMASIHTHNQVILDLMNQMILSPGENLVFHIYLLGDYDEVSQIGDYLLHTYDIQITLGLSTHLGG